MVCQLTQINQSQSPGRRAGEARVNPDVSPGPFQWGWVLPWVFHLFQGRREVGVASGWFGREGAGCGVFPLLTNSTGIPIHLITPF